MRTRVKVCCIASEAEARLAVELGADALGLVGAMPSGPGVVSDAVACAVARSVPPPVATFLLTSRATGDAIIEHVTACGADTVQVVRHIDAAEYVALRARLPGVRRVQVVHVEGADALDHIEVYAPFVDAFLLDSGRPSAATPELGGTGRVHDWEVSREFVRRSPRPVFLAGGLTADNVGEAVARVRPFGLDVCSGVRTDGRLDAGRLAAFLAAVRRADDETSARG